MADDLTLLDSLLTVTVLLDKDMARSFERSGLTLSRTHLLWSIHHSGPSTQQALSAELDVSPRNITGLVDALVETGFVTRESHPTDRRATLVTLTKKGRDATAKLDREHRALAADLSSAVRPADLPALVRGLGAVNARLVELIAGAK
jgi:DNA-binding MarR family transcriptional regulator